VISAIAKSKHLVERYLPASLCCRSMDHVPSPSEHPPETSCVSRRRVEETLSADYNHKTVFTRQ